MKLCFVNDENEIVSEHKTLAQKPNDDKAMMLDFGGGALLH